MSAPRKKTFSSVPHTTQHTPVTSSAAPKRQATAADAALVQLLRQKITEIAQKKPEKAAFILSNWMSATAKTPRKKSG